MWLSRMEVCKSSIFALIHYFANGEKKSGPDVKLDTRFTASEGVRVVSGPDGAALLNIKTGVCCNLDSVGSMIWKQIASSPSGATVESILQHLVETFKVSREEIREETIAYLRKLESQCLLLRDRDKG